MTGLDMQTTVQKIIEKCIIYVSNNPQTGPHPEDRMVQSQGLGPGEGWQINFTTMTIITGNYRYLLVCVHALVRWVRSLPCRSEKTSELIKALLKEIVPRFGLPSSIQSDSGSALIAR